jgi:hypothetical protein
MGFVVTTLMGFCTKPSWVIAQLHWAPAFFAVRAVIAELPEPLDAPIRTPDAHAPGHRFAQPGPDQSGDRTWPEHPHGLGLGHHVGLLDRALTPEPQHLAPGVVGIGQSGKRGKVLVPIVAEGTALHPHRGQEPPTFLPFLVLGFQSSGPR